MMAIADLCLQWGAQPTFFNICVLEFYKAYDHRPGYCPTARAQACGLLGEGSRR